MILSPSWRTYCTTASICKIKSCTGEWVYVWMRWHFGEVLFRLLKILRQWFSRSCIEHVVLSFFCGLGVGKALNLGNTLKIVGDQCVLMGWIQMEQNGTKTIAQFILGTSCFHVPAPSALSSSSFSSLSVFWNAYKKFFLAKIREWIRLLSFELTLLLR